MRQDVESFPDFLQYYRGSYVKSRLDQNIVYMVLGEGGINSVLFRKYNNGREAEEISIPWDQLPKMILFGLPRLGMVAFKQELTFLYYRTVRNGLRGYNTARVVSHSFNMPELLAAEIKSEEYRTSVSYPPFIHVALRHEWTPWDQAARSLTSESPDSLAYALSYNFGAYLPMSGEPVLAYKDSVIGTIQSATKVNLRDDYKAYTPLIQRWISPKIEVN